MVLAGGATVRSIYLELTCRAVLGERQPEVAATSETALRQVVEVMTNFRSSSPFAYDFFCGYIERIGAVNRKYRQPYFGDGTVLMRVSPEVPANLFGPYLLMVACETAFIKRFRRPEATLHPNRYEFYPLIRQLKLQIKLGCCDYVQAQQKKAIVLAIPHRFPRGLENRYSWLRIFLREEK